MRTRLSPAAALAALWLALPAAAAPPAGPAHGLRLPASFEGLVPCADCAGVRWHLDLWPDAVYALHREWSGRDVFRDEVGTWRFDATRKAFVLSSGSEIALQVEVKGPETLRPLDMDGKPIVSRLPYDLKETSAFQPADLRLVLTGEMTEQGGAVAFVECRTGRRYSIARDASSAALRKAYRESAKPAGAPLFVTMDASIVARGPERTIVVRKFLRAAPGETCRRK